MKIEQIKCDKCYKIVYKHISFRKFIKSEMDPSGNGYNNNYDYFDICYNCLIDFIKSNDDMEIL